MIQLGLSRIKRLVEGLPQTFHAIHVAGTNGKGSVCQFISKALKDQHILTGRFTSPHLLDVRESITINGVPLSQEAFTSIYNRFELRSQWSKINATPFELLTATAFQAFNEARVKCAVFECGMGGGRDATNGVLSSVSPPVGSKGRPVSGGEDLKACAVITKVGLDHQEFLGETIREITLEKCGIFSPGSKVVYDETNSPEVLRVIRHATRAKQMWPIVPNFHYWPHLPPPNWDSPEVGGVLKKCFSDQPYMLANAKVAYNVVVNVYPIFFKDRRLDHGAVADSIRRTNLFGRMQPLRLGPLTGKNDIAWLDGAHNRQAMEAVAPVFASKRSHFANMMKIDDSRVPVTWVLAFSEGKDLDDLLTPLDIRPGDRIAAMEFGPVDGMPWKKPMWSTSIYEHVTKRYPGVETVQYLAGEEQLTEALNWASTWPQNKNGVEKKGVIICTGSLYLVGDILRLVRDKKEQEHLYMYGDKAHGDIG